MTNKLNVGVLFGGRSGEHEVSIVSARSVIEALDKSKYNVIPMGITKKGQWIAGPDSVKLLEEGKDPENLEILTPDPTKRELVPIDPKKPSETKKIDVILPILHGPYGEDGTVQGLFELANIPYAGCGVLASACSMDKVIQKKLCEEAGLPIVKPYTYFLSKEWGNNKQDILEKADKIGYPLFIKPSNMGSSVGISKAKNKQELEKGIEEAQKYDRKIIVEKGIDPAREVEVSVLGNNDPKASVAGEVKPSNEFYDYDAKYVDGKSDLIIPADIPDKVMKKIQDLAVKTFKAVDGAGMARVDFLLTPENKIYLNELNTIPGFTAISMYTKLWEASGVPYAELLDKLIDLALERHEEKNKLATSYQPKEDWHKKS